MEQRNGQETQTGQATPPSVPPAPDKQPWQEPKLAFVEPKLTPHGDLKQVTGGFFGTFIPEASNP